MNHLILSFHRFFCWNFSSLQSSSSLTGRSLRTDKTKRNETEGLRREEGDGGENLEEKFVIRSASSASLSLFFYSKLQKNFLSSNSRRRSLSLSLSLFFFSFFCLLSHRIFERKERENGGGNTFQLQLGRPLSLPLALCKAFALLSRQHSSLVGSSLTALLLLTALSSIHFLRNPSPEHKWSKLTLSEVCSCCCCCCCWLVVVVVVTSSLVYS